MLSSRRSNFETNSLKCTSFDIETLSQFTSHTHMNTQTKYTFRDSGRLSHFKTTTRASRLGIICRANCSISDQDSQNVHTELWYCHYNDVIMGAIASQITSLAIVYSIFYSDADERKHQSSVSLAFVWGIHRWPVNSPHKGSATRKMFPFDDVIMVKGAVMSYVDNVFGLVTLI